MGKDFFYLVLFSVWGVADYASLYLVCEKFMRFERRKSRGGAKAVAFCAYVVILYLNALAYMYKNAILFYSLHIIFYFKFLPTMCVRYNCKKNMPFLLFFYDNIIAALGQNLKCILYLAGLSTSFVNPPAVFFEAVISVVALFVLFIIHRYQKDRLLFILFGDLSIFHYVLYTSLLYMTGVMQARIFYLDPKVTILCMLSIGIEVLLLMIIFQSIIVIEHKNSLEGIMELINNQMENITDQYNMLLRKDNEIRAFRHDIKNLLVGLSILVNDNKNEKALKYIEDMQGALDSVKGKYNTGNYMVDIILNIKESKASEIGAEINFGGIVPSQGVKDIDLVVLFSNLIDNALEACQKIEGKKTINLFSVFKNNMWVLQVQNPTITDVKIESNYVGTTKEDKKVHGFGLKSIERVAKKYNGNMEIKCEEQIFTSQLVVYI